MKGIHWVLISTLRDDNVPEFFDSFGRKPSRHEFLKALKNFQFLRFNSKQVQSSFTSCCGVYVCLLAVWRCRGKSFESFLNQFTDSLISNDISSLELFAQAFRYQNK